MNTDIYWSDAARRDREKIGLYIGMNEDDLIEQLRKQINPDFNRGMIYFFILQYFYVIINDSPFYYHLRNIGESISWIFDLYIHRMLVLLRYEWGACEQLKKPEYKDQRRFAYEMMQFFKTQRIRVNPALLAVYIVRMNVLRLLNC